ncbi:MAG: dephospho-CoA kinase, partial [Chloroflexota bacterium]
MYIIGVTGNIGSGKSTVDALLAERGATIVDADALVHQLQRPGQPVYEAIARRFGQGVVGGNGELNRQALGALVFADEAALRDLEHLVHPAVGEESRRLLRLAPPGSVVVYDAVKLLEGGSGAWCSSVWLVLSTAEQQQARLVEQRGLTPDAARARIAAQPPAEAKEALAQIIIRNRGTREDLARQVEAACAATAKPWL